MKISVYLRNAFGLLFLLTLLACQDHQVMPGTPTAPRFRLKKAVTTGTSFYTERTFTYNSAGKLSYATQSNGGGGFSRTTLLTYDSQGRLTNTDLQSAPGRTDIRLVYTYDETGNITTITEYNDAQRTGNLFLERTTSLIYNKDKLPTKVTIVSASRTRTETALYTYVNGNVVKSERTYAPGTTPEIINYQHDDKPNPFYGLLIDAPNPEAINRNNILYDGSERAYNSQGLLVNMNTNVNGAVIDKVRYTYEYEAY